MRYLNQFRVPTVIAVPIILLFTVGMYFLFNPRYDYTEVDAIELANAGEDISGSSVRYTVESYEHNPVFGHIVITEENILLTSYEDPEVEVGKSYTGTFIDQRNLLGGWIFTLE